MGTSLCVLIVEDSEDDAVLVLRELRRGGYNVTHERVDTPAAMNAALDQRTWDIVIADYAMPHFDGLAALALLKQRGLDLPFILVSGVVGEEIAVAAMKDGAQDYIMKGNLARLVPAVERELREVQVHRARHQAEEALRASEAKYRTLVEQLPAITYIAALDEAKTRLYVSPQIETILGFTQAEWLADPDLWHNQLHPDDRERVLAEVARFYASGEQFISEYRMLARDGRPVWFHDEAVVVRGDSGQPRFLQGVKLDITERRRAEEAEHQRTAELARSNTLIAALSQMSARLQSSLNLDRIMDALGTELKQLGVDCFVTLLEPDDQNLVVRYCSLESETLALIEKWTGLKISGFCMPLERFPIYAGVIKDRRAVLLSDTMQLAVTMLAGFPKPIVERVARLVGMTPDNPSIHLPLALEEPVLGILVLWGKNLKEADIPAFSIFASQVAIAIENAGLFEEVRTGHERLQALSHRLVQVQEEQRKLLAADLHDSVVQWLSGTLFRVEVVRRLIAGKDKTGASQELTEIETALQRSIRELRTAIIRLHPPELETQEVVTALEQYVEQWRTRTSIACVLQVKGHPRPLSLAVETGLYRICQEALNNVAKHARARQATVTLEFAEKCVTLTIHDNGVGFDTGTLETVAGVYWYPENRDSPGSHVGLLEMSERAQILGGKIDLTSELGAGTSVSVTIPVQGDGSDGMHG